MHPAVHLSETHGQSLLHSLYFLHNQVFDLFGPKQSTWITKASESFCRLQNLSKKSIFIIYLKCFFFFFSFCAAPNILSAARKWVLISEKFNKFILIASISYTIFILILLKYVYLAMTHNKCKTVKHQGNISSHKAFSLLSHLVHFCNTVFVLWYNFNC